MEQLDATLTALETFRHKSPLSREQELRDYLGKFKFSGEAIDKPISVMSGGEKARLALLELMMSGSNLLILDEPTNHLDINAMEVIEDALLEFDGTLIIVSHDRYLLKKIPTAILELSQDGITTYLGNYDYYEEKSGSVGSAKQYIKNEKKDDLNERLEFLENIKKRDHNKLGRDLELFTTVDVIGQGLPIMLPKGAKVIQKTLCPLCARFAAKTGNLPRSRRSST